MRSRCSTGRGGNTGSPFSYESVARLEGPEHEDSFTQGIYSLVGLGTDGLRRRQAFDDEALLFYAGHFVHYPRCAISLEILLGDYFGLPVQVRQFQGQWLCLAADDQSSLPSREMPQGLNTKLGSNVVAGERVWNVESKLRVRVGPMGYADFRRFLPSGEALTEIVQMTRTYVGPQFDLDIQLVLKGPEAPWCRLGGDGADACAPRLELLGALQRVYQRPVRRCLYHGTIIWTT